MYTHPKIISALATGIVLTMGFSISVTAQDNKPERQVQIKIIENGKVKTDTSYTVDHDFDQKDMDLMLNESPGDKEICYEYTINTDIDQDFETVESNDDVVIKRKVSPGRQQIIVEKTNPNVTIKKDNKGKVEITIEEKISDKKEKK